MAKTKVHGEYLQDSVVRFTAKAGENITKGQPVYISGISGELPVVSLADADDTAKMPAFGLAEATVSTNDELEVTSFGTLAGLDTSTPGYSLGDILYVDTTAGALTNDPAGLEATKLQNIGIVQRVHASNGSIKVGGAGRTNAVPNLNDGDIFIGDANNKAVSSSLTTEIESYLDGGASSPVLASLIVDTDTLYVDSTNNRVGIGTASPVQALDVIGNIQTDGNFRAYDSVSTNYRNVLGYDSGNVKLQTGTGSSAYGVSIFTAGTERFRINGSGSIEAVGNGNGFYVESAGGSNGSGYFRYENDYKLNIANDRGTAQRIILDNDGHINFKINNTEVARFNTDGLTFNGDTAAANALDDYEEGTWIPSLASASGTFSNAGATYTKVGRIVTVNFRLNPSGTAGVVANSTYINNLPFTINSTSGTPVGAFTDVSSSTAGIMGMHGVSSNRIYFTTNYSTTGFIAGTLTYESA